MAKKITRRTFIKESTAIGATTLIGGSILSGPSGLLLAGEKADITVVKGQNYLKSTEMAVEKLGGMKKFVAKNSRVAILPNAQRNNPGAYTNPDVVRAVVRMCKEAGAKEINCLSWLPVKNWENTGLKKAVEEEGAKLVLVDRKDESLFNPVPIKKGKALKEARIMAEFLKSDVFINMPITKDHAGNKFTGTLKNLMGLNSPMNNRTFHKKGWQKEIGSITHLDQSIADLNLIIKPDLCIVDATEFITTNGPFGPCKLIKPQKVVAGTDRVAIDAYCCTLWGLEAKDIIMINKAYEHRLGEIDLKKVKIKEISI
ncbi:MAG: DUF362 domain-containing protein [Planctomycetota bacterium]|jgi:uncharacterized protein (DUF362 family)